MLRNRGIFLSGSGCQRLLVFEIPLSPVPVLGSCCILCITVQNFKQFRHLPRKLYQGLCEVQSRKVRLRLRLLSYNLTFYETKSEDSQSSIQEANIFLRFRTWPYRWKMRSFTLMKPVSDQSWTQLKTGLRSLCAESASQMYLFCWYPVVMG